MSDEIDKILNDLSNLHRQLANCYAQLAAIRSPQTIKIGELSTFGEIWDGTGWRAPDYAKDMPKRAAE